MGSLSEGWFYSSIHLLRICLIEILMIEPMCTYSNCEILIFVLREKDVYIYIYISWYFINILVDILEIISFILIFINFKYILFFICIKFKHPNGIRITP